MKLIKKLKSVIDSLSHTDYTASHFTMSNYPYPDEELFMRDCKCGGVIKPFFDEHPEYGEYCNKCFYESGTPFEKYPQS